MKARGGLPELNVAEKRKNSRPAAKRPAGRSFFFFWMMGPAENESDADYIVTCAPAVQEGICISGAHGQIM